MPGLTNITLACLILLNLFLALFLFKKHSRNKKLSACIGRLQDSVAAYKQVVSLVKIAADACLQLNKSADESRKVISKAVCIALSRTNFDKSDLQILADVLSIEINKGLEPQDED